MSKAPSNAAPNTAVAEIAGPRGPQSRIDALDALRGLAVLGIFAINIIGFSMPIVAFDDPVAVGGDGLLNYGLWTFFEIFIEGSMRGLFSLMFGAGIILFTERATFPNGPIRVADLYYRRMIWLIIFGLIHGVVLLMPGDVLLIYGLAGLFLFPFRHLSARSLAIIGGVILLFLTMWAMDDELAELAAGNDAIRVEALLASGSPVTDEEQRALERWREDAAGPTADDLDAMIASRTGSPASVFADNAQDFAGASSSRDLSWWIVDAWMMMFFGMAFYKWRIVTGARSIKFFAVMLILGYGIGLGIRIWAVSNRWAADFSPLLWLEWIPYQFARVAMTFGHIGLFFLLWRAFSTSLLMRALTAAGRMAFTNYIGQTVIANLIFSGVGFGLYGSFDRAGVHVIMLVIWAAQLSFSMWWLSRYRFGPLEWGWRCLTYWRRQPIRLEKPFTETPTSA